MLTFKQRDILRYISSYQQSNSASPSIQEIADFMKVSSLSTIHSHLESLEERELIHRHKNLARSIEVTNLGRKFIDSPEDYADVDKNSEKQSREVEFVLNEMIDSIVCDDALSVLQNIPARSIDLIVADPPYNLSKGTNLQLLSGSLKGAGGSWSKVLQKWDDYTLLGYLEFTELWLKECKRILKPSGSMWVFGTYHNIGIINTLMQLLSIEIINEVVWYKRNSFPNLAGRRLTASHETLLWAHSTPEKRNYYFNYAHSKAYYDKSDELKAEGKQMRTVWDIPNNKERSEIALGKHPTQKPLKVCKRIIELSSREGDIVLAPFSGAGSECVAAKSLNRRYIGIELEKEYVEISRNRLAAVKSEEAGV